MNRVLVPPVSLVPLALALALAGCREQEPAPAAAPPPPPIARRSAPEHAVATDDDGAQQVIDDDAVRRYLGYWKKSIEVSHRAMEDMARVNKEAERKGGMTGATHALGNNEAIEERAEAQHDALLQEFGFTERQVQELSGLMLAVADMKQATEDSQAAHALAEQKKRLKSVPPEQRPQAQAQLDALQGQLDAQQSLKEAREKYGDAAVDAALRHSEEIVALHKQTFGMLK